MPLIYSSVVMVKAIEKNAQKIQFLKIYNSTVSDEKLKSNLREES